MERRTQPTQASSESPRSPSDTGGDARASLAGWLRAGRAQRGMSVDDVARVTKIQPRILERLEAGKLDGLPADVFVRGFVSSFARCVGLDEREALRRYAACAVGTRDLTPTVRALVEAMADLAPGSASAARATPRKMQAVEVIDLASPEAVALGNLTAQIASASIGSASIGSASIGSPGGSPSAAAIEAPDRRDTAGPQSKKKRGRRRKARAQAAVGGESSAGMARPSLAVGTPPTASPVVASPVVAPAPAAADPVAVAPASVAETADRADPSAWSGSGVSSEASELRAPSESPAVVEPTEPAAPWAPKMPPMATAPSVPWRRPAHRLPNVPVAASVAAVPSLVIDDADPDSAERVLEERDATLSPRRSFLPPILLDREDRSARQGGLTLAVILLLIAATLTLSYLMRRPSASGDGMTGRETATRPLG